MKLSEGLEKGQQLVRSVVTAGLGADRLRPCEGALLLGHVGMQVDRGSRPVRNRARARDHAGLDYADLTSAPTSS